MTLELWSSSGVRCVASVVVAIVIVGATGCSKTGRPANTQQSDTGGTTNTSKLAEFTADSVAIPGADTEIPQWVGQRKDEPFDVRQFLESRMPPADNAAPLCLLALADLDTEMECAYPPEEWQERLPRIRALQEGIGELIRDESRLRDRSVPVEDVERVLQTAQPALKRLDDAQHQHPCVFVTGLTQFSLMPHAQAARTVARLTLLELYRASQQGEYGDAQQAIRRPLRLSRDLRPRGNAICQMVSLVMDRVVLESIRDYALRSPTLTVECCDDLLTLLAEHQRLAIDPVKEGVRMEYVLSMNLLHTLRHRRSRLGVADDWEAELSTCNRCFAALVTLADRPYHGWMKADYQEVEDTTEALIGSSEATLVPQLKQGGGLRPLWQAGARESARLAGVQALLAVRRYELVHQELPADLHVASLESGLESIPSDAYSGQPLRYKVIGQRPIVYSVGVDLQDDGGMADWDNGRQPGDFVFSFYD